MPSLNWIGKEAVANHDKEVPFRLLKKVKSASVGDNSQNLIIHGDNLEALKALMPYYYGKIKCIYIDPPYNTGNEKWIYNDKVNSPKIKQWLGKVVGRESEDLTRHDKWLCMMYPRLKMLRDLLKDEGLIFISVDDNEYHLLRTIMDEIFIEKNFIADIQWNSRKSVSNDAIVSLNHNHTLLFSKNKEVFEKKYKKSFKLSANQNKFSNPDNDSRGAWTADPFDAAEIRKNLSYIIVNPNTGKKYLPPKGRHWVVPEDEYFRLLKDNRIVFGKTGKSKPQRKRFWNEAKEKGITPTTWWDDVGTTTEGTKELEKLFGVKKFDKPKPTRLILKILQLSTDSKKNDFILDSFAGSGTTGHAVLAMNEIDKGNRKFIMIELEDKVAKDITSERIKRAIKEYKYNDGFEFCELDKPLFNESGQIEETCDFKQFATYIYFTETQTNIDPKKIDENFIGENGNSEFYLIYKGKNKNDLNKSFIKKLRKNDLRKVIYADRCLIDDETLSKHNIVFKQIPYEVKVY